MGGRGKSKPTESGFTYYSYHAILKHNNIHFLIQHSENEGGISPPVMAQSQNVIYVTLDRSLEPKHISVYKNRIKQYEIDLDKPHHGISPHIHTCQKNGYRKIKENDKDMVLSEHNKKLVKIVFCIYNKYKKEILGK